jgi:hypothetical protein
MDVRLSSEHLALQDSVARAVAELGPTSVADLGDSDRVARFERVVEDAGWRDLRSGDGAPLASGVEVAIVAEELGRGLAEVAFIGPTLATDARRHAGVPVAGTQETVLVTADLRSPATRVDDGLAIDGRCGQALVIAPQCGLATVTLGEAEVGVDLTRPVASPTGSAVPITTSPEQGGWAVAWSALGLVLTAADLVGVMSGAVQLAVDYVSTRKQFGVPVGSFQAVQHLLADAHVATEGARSLVRYASWGLDALPAAEALAAAAAAKAYAARAARTVCETVIQVHGGIGHTWDCLAHVFLRRALVSIELFGGISHCLDVVLAQRGVRRGDGLR